MRKVLLVIFLAAVFGFFAANSTNFSSFFTSQLDQKFDRILNEMLQKSLDSPKKALSSNPYDYVKNNEYYNKLVELGPSALTYLEDKIKNSKDNGLTQYILAIAAEDIAKVDLKASGAGWVTAKEWAVQWEKYLQNLPASVESIISLQVNDQVKVDKLVQLGLPAIPLLMDKIEQGSTELVPALEELLKGNDQLSFNKDKVKDYQKWVKENKDHEFVQALRRLVIEP